jgi:hypothetical protein
MARPLIWKLPSQKAVSIQFETIGRVCDAPECETGELWEYEEREKPKKGSNSRREPRKGPSARVPIPGRI